MLVKNTLGAVLLIIGTSVGAGILALPLSTAQLGFFPASLSFVVTWFFMTVGALCIIEANLAAGYGTNLISMSQQFLGSIGKWVTWVTYLVLFYALTAAYLTGAGGWIVKGFEYLDYPISNSMAAVISTLLIMGIIMAGIHITDLANRVLMIGLFGVFILLIFVIMPHVDPHLLSQTDLSITSTPVFNYIKALSLPLLLTTFGYAIVVPTLAQYLHGDAKLLYRITFWGSLIPLCIYILWELLILGTLPTTGALSIAEINQQTHPATALPLTLNTRFNALSITYGMSYFSIFALFTSILGVCISLFDFLADGFHIPKNLYGKSILSLITFLPPLVFAYFYPQGFTFALQFAGLFVAILLGIIPALMAWRLGNDPTHAKTMGWVRSKPLLVVTLIFFTSIVVIQCVNMYG